MSGLDLTLSAYAHLHPRVQYFIAELAFLCILIDNHSVSNEALQHYVSRGDTCGEPILEWLAECLSNAHEHFVPYAAGSIVTSTMEAINSEVLDDIFHTGSKASWPLSFVDYRRIKSGASEAYTFLIFDKDNFPDIRSYVHILPYAALSH